MVVVNTCAFIDRAKQESVDAILEMAQEKEKGRARRLVVTGCLTQRYDADLRREIPEIDATLGTGQVERIVEAVGGEATSLAEAPGRPADVGLRPPAAACPFDAALARLRQDQRGLRLHLLVLHHPDAARAAIAAAGSRTSSRRCARSPRGACARSCWWRRTRPATGSTTACATGSPTCSSASAAIDGIRWIRVMYAYPATLSDPILDAIAGEEKVVKYVDIPLQHASEPVLQADEAADRPRKPARNDRADPRAGAGRGDPHVVHRRLPGRDGRRTSSSCLHSWSRPSSTTSASSPTPTRRAPARSTCRTG